MMNEGDLFSKKWMSNFCIIIGIIPKSINNLEKG